MNRSFVLTVVFSAVLGIAIGLILNPLVGAADRNQVALWLEVVHRVCTGIGGLGTFVALIIVLRQFNLLRAQSDFVQKNIVASLDAQLYARLDSFNRFIVEHHQEYDLLNQPYLQEASLEQRSKLHRLCELGFTFYEETFKHHVRYQVLATEDWDEWEQNAIHFFGKAYVRGYWATVSKRYARSFQAFANELCGKIGPASTG
jgi:hypothetical protein